MTWLLLPGMDGSGVLFRWFVEQIDKHIDTRIIRYPSDAHLSYVELSEYVLSQLPLEDDVVIIAESFSGPIALQIAAKPLSRLVGIVLVASFVYQPLGSVGWVIQPLVSMQIWYRYPVRQFMEWFLVNGRCPGVILAVKNVLKTVPSKVLAYRVRQVLAIDCRSEMQRCRVPLLWIQPTKDRLLRSSQQRWVEILCKQYQILSIDCPHLVLQCSAREAHILIADWIKRVLKAN